jgi:hypothetical protein
MVLTSKIIFSHDVCGGHPTLKTVFPKLFSISRFKEALGALLYQLSFPLERCILLL